MQASQKVIAYLNELIGGELAARDQYFIHAEMYKDWGYNKLFEANNHESEHETEHARTMIARVLTLGGTPNMKGHDIHVGRYVEEMIANDLQLEDGVQAALKKGIKLCEEEQDYVSRDLLVAQLKDTEEDHAHWLEQLQRQIKDVGLQNFLQSQL